MDYFLFCEMRLCGPFLIYNLLLVVLILHNSFLIYNLLLVVLILHSSFLIYNLLLLNINTLYRDSLPSQS